MLHWYNYYRISKAVPNADYPEDYDKNKKPEKDYDFDAYRGLKKVDKRLTQEDADQIAKDHPNLSYIKNQNGQFGVAYDIGDGKVMKLSTDSEENFNAKKIIKEQKQRGGSLSYIVHVYDITRRSDGIDQIIIEKVIPLTQQERYIYDRLWYLANNADTFGDYKNLFSNWSKTYGGDITQDIDEFLLAMFNLSKELERNGVEDTDAHSDNVGYRNDGSLVILDLGAIAYA